MRLVLLGPLLMLACVSLLQMATHIGATPHLVHRDRDGNLAVVAVLLTKGNANALIDTLWDNIPLHLRRFAHDSAVQRGCHVVCAA